MEHFNSSKIGFILNFDEIETGQNRILINFSSIFTTHLQAILPGPHVIHFHLYFVFKYSFLSHVHYARSWIAKTVSFSKHFIHDGETGGAAVRVQRNYLLFNL